MYTGDDIIHATGVARPRLVADRYRSCVCRWQWPHCRIQVPQAKCKGNDAIIHELSILLNI
eukprot:scaffold93406_cov28-Attheya_sp.AAC.1